MHYFVTLTCFSHKYFSINYDLIITFFQLENNVFLLLKFWEKHVFIKMKFVPEITNMPVFALHLLLPLLAHVSNYIYFAVVCTFAPFTSVLLTFSILHCSTFLTQWLDFQFLFMYIFFVWPFSSVTILNFYFSHFEICITQDVS